MKTLLTKICLACSNTITKDSSRSLKDWHSRTKYCSIICRAQNANPTGNSGSFSKEKFADKSNHPRWKGGVSALPAYRSLYARRYKARKRGARGSFMYEQWVTLKAFYKSTCMKCLRAEPEIKLEADHINPLARGGSNFIANIQPLCKSCNVRKNTDATDYRISFLDLIRV